MRDSLPAEIYSALQLENFVAIDIETTGLDYQSEEIIEFAAVLFRNGVKADGVSFLIKPTRPIPEKITRITGIANSDVAAAPRFAELLPQIREFVGSYPLVAHNVGFDLPFLEHHARLSGGETRGWDARNPSYRYFPNPKIDTVLLSRLYLPFLNSFSLKSLVDHFQFDITEGHRAQPDAEAAGRLFLEIVKLALKTKFADVQKILQILEPTDDPVRFFFEKLALLLSSGKFVLEEGIDRHQFAVTANHFNIIGEETTPLFGKEELEPLDEDEVAAFFEKGGPLSRKFALYEPREVQEKMARAIAGAFNESQFLVVEAGTGTGKSLAYLVPAIEWAVKNFGQYGKVLVSTNTKNLQEQLFFKDLPVLNAITGEKFKAVLLKGKANYLCLEKWVTVLSDIQYRLSPWERIQMLPLYFWAAETETGDISENHAFRVERNLGLWSKFIAENNYCSGKACKYYDRCFLMKARNNARDAHLVLVNHSLLFSDLAADNAVLGEYVNVILDEAHNIEKTATEYLGVDTSVWQFRDFLKKLYQKDRSETGVLVQLMRRLNGSKLQEKTVRGVQNRAERCMEAVVECGATAQSFFRELTAHLQNESTAGSPRYSEKIRYSGEADLFAPLTERYGELCTGLKMLRDQLSGLIEYYRGLPENSFEHQRQIFQEMSAQLVQCEAVAKNLEFLIEAKTPNFVYWYQLPRKTDSDDTRLYAAPLDISEMLADKFYGQLKTAIFTSATLAVNGSFDYFIGRAGLDRIDPQRLRVLRLDSPFNYEEQVLLSVPSFIPEPSHPEFQERVRLLIEKLATTAPRGTLALFTSYAMLNAVYEGVKSTFEGEQITLLAQGIDGGRHAIMDRFKAAPRSFLFGTDSFWEGVDVPGKALEIVIITKLPFDVPSDPVIQARSEMLQAQGRNPFMEYAVPEAVIRFRQGFGRLIRNRNDYGAVIILDTRVTRKMYGRIFLDSLPVHARIAANEGEFWNHLRRWFGE